MFVSAFSFWKAGIWVAGSASNTGLYYSLNGESWTQSNITTGNFNTVEYTNGYFVVGGGSNNGLYYSTNGINWTATPVTSNNFNSITYDGTNWIAGGDNGVWYTSNPPTGAWTNASLQPWIVGGNLPSSGAWTSMAYGNGTYVAIQQGGTAAAYSTNNGVTWVSSTLPVSTLWNSISYNNGVFVAVAYTRQTAYSTNNGQTWTAGATIGGSGTGWYNSASGTVSGVNYVVSYNNLGPAAYSTNNGVSWTLSTLPAISGQWDNICFGNGIFILITNGTSTAVSSNGGVSWVSGGNLPISQNWNSITYGNGVFVAVGGGGTVAAYSTNNGSSWISTTMPTSSNWQSVTYGNGVFAAISANSTVAACSTNNGKSWTSSSLPSTANWRQLAYGNGIFVTMVNGSKNTTYSKVFNPVQVNSICSTSDYTVVGAGNFGISSGGLFTSINNGVSYTQTSSTIDIYNSVTYDGTNWIAGGNGSVVYTANPTGTWTYSNIQQWIASSSTISSAYSRNYVYGNGNFVSVARTDGASTTFYYSNNNGFTWTASATQPPANFYQSACFGSVGATNYFVTIGGSKAAWSTDGGVNWSSSAITFNNYGGLSYTVNGGTPYFVGFGNTYNTFIRTSNPAGAWSYVATSVGYIGMCATNGVFVALAGNGKVGYSTNGGASWTENVSTGLTSGSCIIYAFGMYIAFSNSGNTFATSGTAISGSWTIQTFPVTFSSVGSLAYTNGMLLIYVFVSGVSYNYYSLDGINWYIFTTTNVQNFFGGGNGYFVGGNGGPGYYTPATLPTQINTIYSTSTTTVLGAGNGLTSAGGLYTSTNHGVSYTLTDSNVDTFSSVFNDGTNWIAASDAGGVYGQGSNNPVLYSSNGTVWTPSTGEGLTRWTASGLPSSRAWTCIAYGNGKFVAVAGNGSSTNVTSYSINGTSWVYGGIMPSSNPWTTVAYGKGKFVAVSAGTSPSYSTNGGVTWTAGVTPVISATGITYGNGRFVLVCGAGLLNYYSLDGISWTTGGVLPVSTQWNSVAYGSNVFVAISTNSSSTAYSTNGGVTWVAGGTLSIPSANRITYGNGTFVAVGSNGSCSYSNNGGLNWFSGTMPSNLNWNSVCYGNGIFVAIASGSNISAYSINGGVTWTAINLPSSNNWQSIVYGEGRFVAITYNSDGASYSNIIGPTSGIISQNGKVIGDGTGNSGLWFTENNGVTLNQSNITTGNYNDSCFS
jgi:hypothetical protein